MNITPEARSHRVGKAQGKFLSHLTKRSKNYFFEYVWNEHKWSRANAWRFFDLNWTRFDGYPVGTRAVTAENGKIFRAFFAIAFMRHRDWVEAITKAFGMNETELVLRLESNFPMFRLIPEILEERVIGETNKARGASKSLRAMEINETTLPALYERHATSPPAERTKNQEYEEMLASRKAAVMKDIEAIKNKRSPGIPHSVLVVNKLMDGMEHGKNEEEISPLAPVKLTHRVARYIPETEMLQVMTRARENGDNVASTWLQGDCGNIYLNSSEQPEPTPPRDSEEVDRSHNDPWNYSGTLSSKSGYAAVKTEVTIAPRSLWSHPKNQVKYRFKPKNRDKSIWSVHEEVPESPDE